MQVKMRSVVINTSEEFDAQLVDLPECMMTAYGQPMIVGIHVEPDTQGEQTRIWYIASKKEY